jgi:hypothetical protein
MTDTVANHPNAGRHEVLAEADIVSALERLLNQRYSKEDPYPCTGPF